MISQNNNPPPASAVTRPSRGKKDQQKKEKPKVSTAIKPEQFQTKKGLRALYQNTKALKLDEYSEINVENTMKKVVSVLKTWHQNFVPKYSFDYFLQRCQALGGHKLVTAYMSKVRRIHKGTDQWQEVEANNQLNLANQNNENANLENDLNILNGRPNANRKQEEEDDEDHLFELMYNTERRAENKRDEPMEYEQQYVPEGFGFTVPPDEDD